MVLNTFMGFGWLQHLVDSHYDFASVHHDELPGCAAQSKVNLEENFNWHGSMAFAEFSLLSPSAPRGKKKSLPHSIRISEELYTNSLRGFASTFYDV